MGKERSLVPVKLTPSSHLDLTTNVFVLWGCISGDPSCRTPPSPRNGVEGADHTGVDSRGELGENTKK